MTTMQAQNHYDVSFTRPDGNCGKIIRVAASGIFAAHEYAKFHASYMSPWTPDDITVTQVIDSDSDVLLWWLNDTYKSPIF